MLIDTATDLRVQVLREGIYSIDAVLYTHTHADHLHGIDDLRPFNKSEGEKIPLYGTAETIKVIERNFRYIFGKEEGYRPCLEARRVEGPVDLWGQTIIPVPLCHGRGSSIGFRVGSFAYLTDCSAIPEESFPLLDGTDVLVIDGLRFRSHQTHFNIAQAIDAAERVGARRTLLTHLSHDVDHDACSALLPEGVELAYDGLRMEIPLKHLLGATSPGID